jgi:hypothetical protein
MKKHNKAPTGSIRRSVALPGRLVADIMELAPEEASRNWNRLVVTALEEYAARRRRLRFEATMAEMASDPAIQAASKSINEAFRHTASDGLKP